MHGRSGREWGENKESGTGFRSDCGLTVINISVCSKIFTASCVSALS